jgi:hypothetical protein
MSQITDLHNEKIDACTELVEELSGAPVIICYDTHHDRIRLEKAFKHTVCRGIGGHVSPGQTQETIREWNAGEVAVLLVQPQAAGHGVNLQSGGRHIIWHSLTWDLEVYQQMIARIWRQGQADRVFCYHIIARKTVDEKMLVRLREKRSIQDALLVSLK